MLCVVYGRSSGHTYTGGSDGRVYHWEGNSLLTAVDAHKGPLFAMQAVEKVSLTRFATDYKHLASEVLGIYWHQVCVQ